MNDNIITRHDSTPLGVAKDTERKASGKPYNRRFWQKGINYRRLDGAVCKRGFVFCNEQIQPQKIRNDFLKLLTERSKRRNPVISKRF